MEQYIAIPMSEYEELKMYKKLYTEKFNVDNECVSLSDNVNGIPAGCPIYAKKTNDDFCVTDNSYEEPDKKSYGRETIW